MICEWWPLFREGVKDVSWGFILILLISTTAWIMSIVIERSCDFLEVQTSDGEQSFGRGLTRGKLEPTDSCKDWRQYSGLELDTAAATSFIAALTSVALGAFVLCYLMVSVCCQPFPRFFKGIIIATCILLAALQGMTQSIYRSAALCQDVNVVVESEGGGNTFNYNTCSRRTTAYFMTFFTIGLWPTVAGLFLNVNLHKVRGDDEDENRERGLLVVINVRRGRGG